jgi:hypothetical protein
LQPSSSAFRAPILEVDADAYPTLIPLLDISVPELDRSDVSARQPFPVLPSLTTPVVSRPVTSLHDANGQPITVERVLRRDTELEPFFQSDPTAPFAFVVAVMTLFGVLLGFGVGLGPARVSDSVRSRGTPAESVANARSR